MSFKVLLSPFNIPIYHIYHIFYLMESGRDNRLSKIKTKKKKFNGDWPLREPQKNFALRAQTVLH